MFYRLFGFCIRLQACKLAAKTYRNDPSYEGYSPYLWSLCVFYENYLCEGSNGTRVDFGPKEEVPSLKVVK